MSANVESMFYVGRTPWHGLGTELQEEDGYDLDKCRVSSGLDWDAELVGMETNENPPQLVPEAKTVRRVTDKKILGVVGNKYKILQNSQAFNWFKPFLDTKEAVLHTAGSLDEGRRVWILAKINRSPLVVAQGDEVEKYLLLSHSHDGSLSIRPGFTPIRVVCSNTLAMAHADKASKLLRVKHTEQAIPALETIRDTINLANLEFEATGEKYKLLANKGINSADLQKYIKLVLDIPENEKVSTRSKNIMSRIAELFENGRGNTLPSVKGTYWAAYNGVAEYLSYDRGRNTDTRLNSLWFADSANVNKNALDVALAMAA